jgi:hypothetical protein
MERLFRLGRLAQRWCVRLKVMVHGVSPPAFCAQPFSRSTLRHVHLDQHYCARRVVIPVALRACRPKRQPTGFEAVPAANLDRQPRHKEIGYRFRDTPYLPEEFHSWVPCMNTNAVVGIQLGGRDRLLLRRQCMLDQDDKEFVTKLANQVLMVVGTTLNAHFGMNGFDASRDIIDNHKNPINRCGNKVFSQNEEDGITLEIARRLGVQKGVFAEFGVGNGLENNSLVLAALGWKGFWVGNEALALDSNRLFPANKARVGFEFVQAFVTRDNVLSLFGKGLGAIAEWEADVISLDLDGNDIYIVEEILSGGIRPKLFIVEYSAKWVPPIRWKIEYDPAHTWNHDDYFGASLCSFCDLFTKHGYILVCTNALTGSNAFFVDVQYAGAFDDIPRDIDELWSAARYITSYSGGHKVSAKTVEQVLGALSE